MLETPGIQHDRLACALGAILTLILLEEQPPAQASSQRTSPDGYPNRWCSARRLSSRAARLGYTEGQSIALACCAAEESGSASVRGRGALGRCRRAGSSRRAARGRNRAGATRRGRSSLESHSDILVRAPPGAPMKLHRIWDKPATRSEKKALASGIAICPPATPSRRRQVLGRASDYATKTTPARGRSAKVAKPPGDSNPCSRQ
jgi:hypothetical protein